jgi:hypothetical protein
VGGGGGGQGWGAGSADGAHVASSGNSEGGGSHAGGEGALGAGPQRWNGIAAQNYAAQLRERWKAAQPAPAGPGGGPGRTGHAMQRFPAGTGYSPAHGAVHPHAPTARSTFIGGVDSYTRRHAESHHPKGRAKKQRARGQLLPSSLATQASALSLVSFYDAVCEVRDSYETLNEEVLHAQHGVAPLAVVQAEHAALRGRASSHVPPEEKAIALQRHEAAPKLARLRRTREAEVTRTHRAVAPLPPLPPPPTGDDVAAAARGGGDDDWSAAEGMNDSRGGGGGRRRRRRRDSAPQAEGALAGGASQGVVMAGGPEAAPDWLTVGAAGLRLPHGGHAPH